MIMLFILSLVSGDMRVKSPKLLADQFDKEIIINQADYGFIPYGQQISGELFLAQPLNACNLSVSNIGDEFKRTSFILLAKRGQCPFVQKSLNAQLNGFSMIIIVDDREEDSSAPDIVSYNQSIFIKIPAVMISKQEGDKIIDFMVKSPNEPIKTMIKFSDVEKAKTVNYSYWFSVMDSQSYTFIEEFYPFHKEMLGKLNFTPHFALTRYHYFKEGEQMLNDPSCLSGGRYCDIDPDGDGPLSGRDAVMQVLKQICINQQNPLKWWTYAIYYRKNCLTPKFENYAQCEKDALANSTINQTSLSVCVNSSFLGKQNPEVDDNFLLGNELSSHQNLAQKSWPILIVNRQIFKGSLNIQYQYVNTSSGTKKIFDTNHYGPLEMICEGFTDDSKPQRCEEFKQYYIDGENIYEHEAGSSTFYIWIIVVLFMLVIMGFSLFCYRREYRKKLNQQIQQDVNIYLAQYYTLNEQATKK
ncbi:hypothetical protein pb186bvf_010263 [Paramecium bursaria]